MQKSLIIFLFIFCFALPTQAASLGEKLSGKILLNVEKDGEAWYINPSDNKRYFLGRPADAFFLMRELGLGISNYNIQKLAKEGMPDDLKGDLELARKLSGKILLQIEENGEAWYMNPDDLRLYFLGRPDDAFRVMRELSLGISRENLAKIHKPGLSESLNSYSSYEHKTLETSMGNFKADIVIIDLDNPNLEIITDTAMESDCDSNCQAKTLGEFVVENDATIGMNGTYFEAYSSKLNYYFSPVYNTEVGVLINEDQLKYWTTGPVMAFDTENNLYYYKDSREFESVASFESSTGATLQAAISNKPRLIENGMNQLIVWDVDKKQETAKAARNALAYRAEEGKKGELLLVIVYNATVLDLAEILKEMDVDIALNLDGGYSTALWYNDEYMSGPGRDVPNVILFREKND
ncbi:hypothetical protein C0583_02290 [Candidatus Parcubacteria bacterium]|nr:MAG: hypothetical protein C0583_02290 [Candidatus Parcubacteria bacterium]